MFAKIFQSIYDGSLRKDWKSLVIFQQMLVLADREGYVDMTPEAISARTSIPLEMVNHGLRELSSPDEESRSQSREGRRLVPINPERKWGWVIVNFRDYRDIINQEDLRAYWRGQKKEKTTGSGNKREVRGKDYWEAKSRLEGVQKELEKVRNRIPNGPLVKGPSEKDKALLGSLKEQESELKRQLKLA